MFSIRQRSWLREAQPTAGLDFKVNTEDLPPLPAHGTPKQIPTVEPGLCLVGFPFILTMPLWYERDTGNTDEKSEKANIRGQGYGLLGVRHVT